MADNIKVAVRVRPLLQRETSNGLNMLWLVKDKGISACDSSSESYIFDSVYDHLDTNEELYGELCSPIIKSAMAGFHGTIFAYGQSGSGKTHTMTGSKLQPGVIDQAVDEIFDLIEQESSKKDFLLRISYMEIYTERIFDLFDDAEKTLKIQEDTNHNITVVNLTEQIVNSKKQLLQWMIRGETKRKFAETKANDRSSRSHVILRLIIESRLKGDVDAVMVSHLNFVDLAGSERAADNSGDRFREGCAINRSLLILSQVISKLSEGDGNAYIGYRDSKLTRILQNALGGNSNTLIICTIGPASMDESHSTLRFASRAKQIKNKPERNEVLSDSALLKKYATQIKKLQRLVDDTGVHGIKLEKEDLEKQLQEKEVYQKEQEELINKLRTMLVVSATHKDSGDAKQKKQRRETWCGPKLRKNSVFHDFSLPLKPLSLPEGDSSTSALSSRHRSFPVLEEEEDVSFVEAPFPVQLAEVGDDSIFFPPDNARRSYITDSRHSGRKSESERSRKVSEEMDKLMNENSELQQENSNLGERVLELESSNTQLERDMSVLKEKLNQLLEDMALQSLELDKAYGLARHEMSLCDLQEFHRLEKEDLEDQIETLAKKKSDLEGQMVPADAQYVKNLEQELASNYNKVVDLNKANKDMEAEISKLKKELQQSKGEVDRKLRTNDDYIMTLEKQVNTSQEKLKNYERMSVGGVPAGAQMNSTFEATIDSLMKDKANLEKLLENKNAEVTQISEEKNNLRSSLDNKITEMENFAEEKKCLSENMAADAPTVTQLESKLQDMQRERTQDAERFGEEKQLLEKMLEEKDAEVKSLVEKLKSITVETRSQDVDEMKAVNEKIMSEKNAVEEHLLSAKQELETLMTEKMEMEDKLLNVERMMQDQACLEEQLKIKSKEIEILMAEKEEILNSSKKRTALEKSQRMSQSDVIIHSIDADITVSNLDLSIQMSNMSKCPMSLADELAAVSQPLSLADELAGVTRVSQPLSLADELAGASQPVSLADELESATKPHKEPVSLADELTNVSNTDRPSLADEVKTKEAHSARTSRDIDLQTSFELQNNQISEIQDELISKCKENESALKDMKHLEGQLELKELEVQSLTVMKSKLEKELEQKQEELETFSNEMMRLQDLVDETQEKRTSTEQDIREQKEALDDEKMKIKKLQQELETRDGGDSGNGEGKDSLEELLSQKMEELQTSLKEKREMELKMETLQGSLEEQVSEKGQMDSLSSRVKDLEDILVSKEEQLVQMKKDYEDKEAEVLQMKQMQSIEQSNISEQEAQTENLLLKIAELENTVEDQTQQLYQVKTELEERDTLIKEHQQLTVNEDEEEEDEISFATKEPVTVQDTVKVHGTEAQDMNLDSADTAEVSEVEPASDVDNDIEGQNSQLLATKETAIQELKTKVFELEAILKEKTELLEQVRTEYEQQDIKLKSLQQSVENGNQQIADFEENMKNLKCVLEERESDIETLKADKERNLDEVDELKQQLEDTKDTEEKFNESSANVEGLLQRVEELGNVVQEKDCDLTRLQDELQHYQENVQSLTEELDTSIAAVVCKETEIRELVQKTEIMETLIAEKDSKMQAELSEALHKYKDELKTKEQEMRSLNSKIDHLEFCIAEESMIGEGAATVEEMKIKLESLREEISTKDELVVELTGKVTKLENDLEERDLDVEAKSKQIEEMIEEIAQGKVELEAKTKEAALLEERISNVEEQIIQQEAEFEDIKEAGMAKINSLTEESLDLQDQVADLENCLKEKEADLVEITHQVEEIIEEKIHESRLEVQEKESELRALLEKVLALEDAVKEKDAEIESVLSEKVKLEEGGEEMVRLVHEKHDLEEKLREKSGEVVTLMEEKSRVELDLNHKTTELQVMVEYKSKQDAELEEKITVIESLSNEILRLEDALVEKTQDLELLQEEKASTEFLLTEKSTLLEDLGQKMNEFENLFQEKSDEVDECRIEIETLRHKLAITEEQLQEARNDKSSEEKLLKEIEKLQITKQQKEKEISNLRSEIAELKNNKMNLSTSTQPEQADEAAKQNALLTQLFIKLNKSGKSNLTEIIETLDKEGRGNLANQLREQNCILAKEKIEVDKRINILDSEIKKKDKIINKKDDDSMKLYKTISEKEDKILFMEDEMESIKENMQKVEVSKVDLKLEVHYLRNKMKEEQANYEDRKGDWEEEVEYKNEAITRLKGEIRKLQQTHDTSYMAPPQPEPATKPVEETSSRNGVIDKYRVCILEGEKKEMQTRIRELRKQVQTLLVEIKELKQQNTKLGEETTELKNINEKENPTTPNNKVEKVSQDISFNLDFLKKRRSLTYEDIKKMAAPYKEKPSTALSPIKDSSRVNEMMEEVKPMYGSTRLSQRKSLSKADGTENCKVQ